MSDHIPVRYAVKTAVRHRLILTAGWVLGHLPQTWEDVSW